MRRVVVPELLDTDAGTPEEVRRGLADLRMVNRWFGGARVTRRLIERVAQRTQLRSLSFLDVAGASADAPRSAQHCLQVKGIRLAVTVLDRSSTHLDGSLPAVVGDALHLPFGDSSFDLVGSSLFTHHLEPDEVVAFVREALRVCRRAVLINDLRRHALHLALVYAGMPLYSSRITRHDGPVSVRRAYTAREMRGLVEAGGAKRVEITRYYLFRMGLIAWRD